MEIFVLLDNENNISSYFFDEYPGSTKVEIPLEVDLSKLIYYKYENNELLYSNEREVELKLKEEEYRNQPNPLTIEEQLRLEMARSNAEMFEMMVTMMGGVK